MKKAKKALSVLLALALVFALCSTAFAAETVITNPYENVDWETVGTYKAALHSHTNASDGDQTLTQSLERHAESGFDVVAITDHGTVDYGWTKDNAGLVRGLLKIAGRSDGKITPIEKSGSFENGMTYSYYTAENGDDYLKINGEKEILRIPFGIENNAVSVNAHVNSWFADYHNNSVTTYEDAVRGVEKLGGVSVINHPGEYTKARYEIRSENAYNENSFAYKYYINKFASLLEKYPTCIGIDINSKGDARTRFDRILWDKLLTRFSKKGETVYAIGSSDAHQLDKINTGYTLLLMESLDSQSAKKALENGEFFAASHCIGNYDELRRISAALGELYGESEAYKAVTAAADEMQEKIEGIESGKYDADSSIGVTYSVLDENGRLTAKTEPKITSVKVEGEKIKLETKDALLATIISDGKALETKKAGEVTFDLSDYGEQLGDYVRIEVFGEGGVLYTQAFLLNAGEKDSSLSAVDKGFFDAGILDFLFGELQKLFAVIARKFG